MARRPLLRIAAATALLFGIAADASPASAQTTTPASATMRVSVEVLPNCAVVAEPLAFGAVTAAEAPGRSATASIEVACGPSVPFTVALDGGQYADGGTRRALDPATGRYVAYDIFADAAHSLRWGSSGAEAVSAVTTSAGTARLAAYGRLDSSTQVEAGRYDDIVTVTIGF